MIILLMGPQACGKGTQGEMLSDKLDLPLIGVGDLLRKIPSADPNYAEVSKRMLKGELVSGDIVSAVLKRRVNQPDCKNGYILDGWARSKADLDSYDPHPTIVLFINISHEETVKRIAGRRICKPTGEVFNINSMTPDELAKCPGPLVQREDDTEAAIKERLAIFDRETLPVIADYRAQKRLIEIDGIGKPEDIFIRILEQMSLFGL